MPSPRKLVIFAGAHKTASSHLQHSLIGSSDALKDLGVAVIGPKDMRRDLTPFSELLRDGMTDAVVRAGANGFLDHYAGDADTVALMDENILGSTDRRMLMRKSRLYPWGPRRIARLLELFEGHAVELAISVRNPATFLPSCWCESLLHDRYADFDSFAAGFDGTGKIWSGFIARLQKETTAPITLWRYEDYKTFGTSLFDHLLKPGVAKAIRLDPQTRRSGLSAKAAEWFQAQDKRDKDTVQEARQRFPKTGPETAFSPWSNEEQAALTRSYERDVKRLQSHDGLRLLLP